MTGAMLGRLAWVLAAVLAVTAGLAAGPLPWRLMGESGLPERAPSPAAAPEPAPVALEPILALMPFGRRAEPEAPAPAQETGLSLTLHGVVLRTPPQVSSAIVSGEGARARAYAVGDEVAAGAVLAEIEGGHVVLEIAGRRETLSFPERRPAAGARGGGARTGGGGSGSGSGVDALRALVSSQTARPAAAPADAAPAANDPAADDPEAAIADLRARVQANPSAVLGAFGLTAGEAGYTVGPDASDALRSAGLRPGDVVTQVNGQQIGDIDRDRRLFDEVVAAGRARVEVLRDGRPIALSFPLR